MHTHAQTHTHPGESPASLPPLVSVFLLKKKDYKKSLQPKLALIVVPSRFYLLSIALQLSVVASTSLQEASYPTFKCSPPYFFSCPVLLLSLLTSLHCSTSQLSFPAVCLSTASPSSSSFLPALSHFCLPTPLPLVFLF